MNNELIERINTRNQAWVSDGMKDKIMTDCKAEIERLTKALEAKPIGEPVAFRANVDGVWFVASTHKFMKATLEKSDVTAEIHPLYTAPPNIDALIAEIDEVIFDEYSGGYFHRLDIGGAEITDVLDKYRSTK